VSLSLAVADSNLALATLCDNTVWMLTANNGVTQIVGSGSVLSNAVSIAVSPLGSMAVIVSRNKFQIIILTNFGKNYIMPTSTLLNTLAVMSAPQSCVYSSDQSFIVYVDSAYNQVNVIHLSTQVAIIIAGTLMIAHAIFISIPFYSNF
jgi:DNA-binding beta-propeller fold protein YncE